MGDKVSTPELMTENVELSNGMLGIIGAYGMRSALDVRDLYLKAESPPPERIVVHVDTDMRVRPRNR